MSMTWPVWMPIGSLRSKYPGTTVAQRAFTRLPTSTAVRQVARNLSRNSALPVASEVFQLSPPSMTNTPMVMPRRASVAPMLRLHLDRPTHEPVVFERGEPLRGHELELGHQIFAGMRLEHAEVRRVAQLEFAFRGGCLRGDRAHQQRAQGLQHEFSPAGHDDPLFMARFAPQRRRKRQV